MDSSTPENEIKASIDLLFSIMGMSRHTIFVGLSLFWSLGLKDIHYYWIDNIFVPQIENDINAANRLLLLDR